MHWGHASSTDLVRWTDLPIALAPSPGGPDRSGCFSGDPIDWDGVPTLFYYGHPGGMCIATSDDRLLSWRKHPGNPVIPQPPEGEGEWRAFDPCVWKAGDTWHALSGGRVEGAGDTAFLFQSPDLLQWEYVGLFYGPGTESDCAVPDFFPLGDKHMLLFASHARGVQYYLGTYSDGRFNPERHGRMNFGGMGVESGDLCAAYTALDDRGRRIMMGWVPEGRKAEVQRVSGWAGIMCLPRVLSLPEDGTLRIEPLPELETLRRSHHGLKDLDLAAGSNPVLQGIQGSCLEIAADIEMGDAEEVGIEVLRSADGRERTAVYYSRDDASLCLDTEGSSLSPDVQGLVGVSEYGSAVQRGPLELGPHGRLQIRVFVDRSVVEAFASDRQCVTKRVDPSRPDSLGVALFARGGGATVRSLDVWQMASVWPEMGLQA
jgi:beta-fructofuranosidase